MKKKIETYLEVTLNRNNEYVKAFQDVLKKINDFAGVEAPTKEQKEEFLLNMSFLTILQQDVSTNQIKLSVLKTLVGEKDGIKRFEELSKFETVDNILVINKGVIEFKNKDMGNMWKQRNLTFETDELLDEKVNTAINGIKENIKGNK